MSTTAASHAASPAADSESSKNDIIDWTTFNQILEMDEDEVEREFSTSIVTNFFDQAEVTFEQMEKALDEKDLAELSSLGHFLKGSSAALGLTKVKDSCEKIQHLGAGKDEQGLTEIDETDVSLDKIRSTLDIVIADYEECRLFLLNYFGLDI